MAAPSSERALDKARELVRTVVRAFYEPEHIITVDALVNHVALSTEDMRIIFSNTGRNNKDLQKVFGRLKEGGLVSVFARQETKPNAQKPTTVEYFYIDFRRAIDATKYRVHKVSDKLGKNNKASEKRKDLSCSRCKGEYEQLEVMESFDMATGNFICPRCGNVLTMVEHTEDSKTGLDSVVGMFNRQADRVVEILREIEAFEVPETRAEIALEERRPVPRDKAPIDFPKQESLESKVVRPTAVKGMATGPERVEVSISTKADDAAAAATAEMERKLKKMDNAVPEWYTHSTVSNEITALGLREAAALADLGPGVANPLDGDEKPGEIGDDSLDAFYAALEEEKAHAQQREEDGEEDDEGEPDENEYEFEDVGIEAPNDAVAKRVKLENGDAVSSASTPLAGSGTGTVDSDDEDDFEDVAV